MDILHNKEELFNKPIMSLSEKNLLNSYYVVSSNEVHEIFNQIYSDRMPISQSTLCTILRKYEKYGHVDEQDPLSAFSKQHLIWEYVK